MSIQNGRLYQLVRSKVRWAPLALALAWGVRLIARLALAVTALVRGGAAQEPSAERVAEARERISAVFPKPTLTREPANDLPVDPAVDLSVIVPVYNNGAFFEPCMRSLYEQETRYRYEVLLVDDGSDEATAQEVDTYADRPGTTVLRQPNAGAAAARNRALDHARGEYVLFVDADDLLLPGAIEVLMSAARAQNADFVQGSWKYLGGTTQRFPTGVYEGERRMALLELPGMPWGKVIRRSLFTSLRFPAGYSSYVDSPIKCLVFPMSARVATLGAVTYAWRRNPDGITFTSKAKPRALQTYWLMEPLLEDARALGLPDTALQRAIWLRQLTTVSYDRLKGMDEGVRRDVFTLSCALLRPVLLTGEQGLPFALRMARRAFLRQDFALWQLIGRLYPFVC